jgi:hypothetical protein
MLQSLLAENKIVIINCNLIITMFTYFGEIWDDRIKFSAHVNVSKKINKKW